MTYQHILFAADFSDEALKIGERAKSMAQKYGARLSMIHGLALLLGSTANAVLHGAPCDVLAVRI